jgi:DNA polymerase-3 subunit delta'
MSMQVLITDGTRAQIDAIKSSQSGSYIFHGASGMGKSTMANEVARRLNCQGDDPTVCASCRVFASDSYPDLITIQPEDKPSIGIEQVRGLVQTLALSLYYPAGTRVVIINQAHVLTTEAQNALLKLIEEPPPQTIFILATDHVDALLPTVRSRCAAIYFPPVPEPAIAEFLASSQRLKPSDAAALASASGGAPGVAVRLAADPAEATARHELADLATTAANSSLFDRLLIARRLTDTKAKEALGRADLIRFGQLLHARLVQELRSGVAASEPVAQRLAALELFRRQLQAKVAPRVALERLMLEL